MADYIYLLQNRLTPPQRRALEAVREAARHRNMPVFLVGGAVRDLSSGAPVRDLDFAVQGDTSGLLDDLKSGGAAVAGVNPVLSSTYLIFPGGVRAEVGPTLTVSYPKPGRPEAQAAAILEDLRRRDFTANAMAISLNEGSYGLLLDPLNGIADMENRELRLVSNYGFIEQPSLLLRAARLSSRLGWTLEERTQGRYETAREEKYIDSLSAADRGHEVEDLFHEDDPVTTLERLTEEGWSAVLFPAWTTAKVDREGLDKVRDVIGQMEQMGIFVDPSPVFFPLLTAKLSGRDVAALKAMFPRQGFVGQIDSLEARSKELSNQLTARNVPPSDTWKLLFSAEPEVLLWLAYSGRSGGVQAKLKAFLTEWPQAKQKLPYAIMQEMRITPDLAGYDQLLEALFFAQLDGKLSTPEATRAFLEPYSPPAPVVQATPRRRPAKSSRARGKKAAERTVAAEGTSPEAAEQEPESASRGGAVPGKEAAPTPAKAAARAPLPASKTAAKAAAKTPSQETAAAVPAQKVKPAPAPVTTPAKPPLKNAKASEQRPAAKKSPAKPAIKAPAPAKAASKQAAKSVPGQKKPAAVKKAVPARPGPRSVTPAAKKQAVPSKAAAKAKKAAVKPAAKKSARPAVPVKSAGKTAAKKVAASARRPALASKKTAPAARKGRGTASKGRGH